MTVRSWALHPLERSPQRELGITDPTKVGPQPQGSTWSLQDPCPIPQPGSPAWHQNRPEATPQSIVQSRSKSCVPESGAERAALRAAWKFMVDAQRSRVRMGIGTPPTSLGGQRGISRKGFLQPALSSDLSLRHHSAERTGHSSKPMGSPCGTSSPHSRHLAISGDLFWGHSWQVLLESDRQRLEMPLNNPQCKEHPPTKNHPAPNVSNIKD